MPTPTKSVLDFQSDLKRSTAPVAGIDVPNKTYVDSLVAGATPPATSAAGGGTLGLVRPDSDKGLNVPTGGILQVKVDGVTIGFNGSGQLVGTATVPTATSANGGGVQGKATYDDLKGLHVTAGVAEVKIDGVSVTFNGSGQLVATAGALGDATSAPGGGVKGKVTLDSNLGLAATAGVARVKVDGTTVTFDGSGQLKAAVTGTGLTSRAAAFTRIIPATTAPSAIVLGTNVDASSYPDGSTTGEKFEFDVPDDYFSGGLEILLVYSMSSAVGGPNNVVRVSTAAEIARTTGVIDAATYPETQQNLTTPITTAVTRSAALLTLAPGSFEAGDRIALSIKRFGASGFDLHTGAFQVISYEWRYTTIAAGRIVNAAPDLTFSAAGETATGLGTVGVQLDVDVFPTGANSGLKFDVEVPDNWDQTTDAYVSFIYAMSSAAVGNVRLDTYGEVADAVNGTIAVIPSALFTFAPPVNTTPHRLLAFRAIPAALFHRGDALTVVAARRVAVGGNHPGSFQLIGITVQFTIIASAGIVLNTITEGYLKKPTYLPISGTTLAVDTYPTFGGNFDELYAMSSTSAAARMDAAFAGRLGSFQTQIASIRVNIVGTGASPQYHLQVYAEGTGLVYDSGLQPAPGVLTELVVLAAGLSAQPTGSKRFHVVVQAFIDAAESVSVSAPFVRQE